jgi:hypothetical protein
MRRLIALVTTLTAAVFIAGCGSQADRREVAPSASPTLTQHEPATLTVATSLSTDGPMYIEGALAQIVLRDEGGAVVDRATKWPGKPIVFDGLEPGSYSLEPALRPCDGNCGYLDPPTDSCRRMLTVDADLTLTVRFSVGHACEVVATA